MNNIIIAWIIVGVIVGQAIAGLLLVGMDVLELVEEWREQEVKG